MFDVVVLKVVNYDLIVMLVVINMVNYVNVEWFKVINV